MWAVRVVYGKETWSLERRDREVGGVYLDSICVFVHRVLVGRWSGWVGEGGGEGG